MGARLMAIVAPKAIEAECISRRTGEQEAIAHEKRGARVETGRADQCTGRDARDVQDTELWTYLPSATSSRHRQLVALNDLFRL